MICRVQHIYGLSHRTGIGKGAEISRLILLQTPRQHDPRKCLIDRNLDIRIGFVVLEHRVVLGTVFLYQIVLQHKRLKLRVGHYILKVSYMRDHPGDLGTFLIPLLKILMYAVSQIDRLSHIDDLIMPVMHDVHTRLLRELFQFFLYHEGHTLA